MPDRISVRDETTVLVQLVIQYLHYCEYNLHYAPGTVKHRVVYLGQMERFLIGLGIKDIREVSKYDIDDFLAERSIDCSENTINDIVRSLRMFFSWVSDYKEIQLKFNPESAIKYLLVKRRRAKPVAKDIIYKAIRGCRQRQDKLVIATLYESGMRMAEIISFRIEDLDGIEIHITGKGDLDRLVYITPKLADGLRLWAAKNGWRSGCFFRPLQHSDGDEGYGDTEQLRQRIKKRFLEVGEDMHPHQIRHAYAIRLLKSGIDIRTLQKLLGHTSLETTMRYLNVSDAWLMKQYAQKYGRSALV